MADTNRGKAEQEVFCADDDRKRWTPEDHPPHRWPIGSPGAWGWAGGYGCPTSWCKGEGSQRDESFNA